MFVLLIERLLPKREDWTYKPEVNDTNLMTVVAPTDRLTPLRNRCVIKRFVASLCGLTMHCLSSRSICHTTASDI